MWDPLDGNTCLEELGFLAGWPIKVKIDLTAVRREGPLISSLLLISKDIPEPAVG